MSAADIMGVALMISICISMVCFAAVPLVLVLKTDFKDEPRKKSK